MLYLLQGPAGSGKSQLARDMLEAGEADVLADVTQLWAGIGGYERDPATGKYPIRQDDDPALDAALYVQATVVHFALRQNRNVIVTTSRPDQVERWKAVADEYGAPMQVRTVDPGIDVIRARLADAETGEVIDECEAAIGNWYGAMKARG